MWVNDLVCLIIGCMLVGTVVVVVVMLLLVLALIDCNACTTVLAAGIIAFNTGEYLLQIWHAVLWMVSQSEHCSAHASLKSATAGPALACLAAPVQMGT
jgi:hypothetical protein